MKQNIIPVILAAGMGTRLEDLTLNIPKCLLKLNNKTILYHSLDNIAMLGFREVVIVAGFMDDVLKSTIENEYTGIKSSFIYNPQYADTGSIVSLAAAINNLPEKALLIFESDIIYDKNFLNILLQQKDDAIMVADLSGSGDEVYVCVDEHEYVVYLGKSVNHDVRKKAIGEFAGITLLSSQFCQHYLKNFNKLKSDHDKSGHYEEFIFSLVDNNFPVRAIKCTDCFWMEVDNKKDLNLARRRFNDA